MNQNNATDDLMAALANHPNLILISGRAGVGKTTAYSQILASLSNQKNELGSKKIVSIKSYPESQVSDVIPHLIQIDASANGGLEAAIRVNLRTGFDVLGIDEIHCADPSMLKLIGEVLDTAPTVVATIQDDVNVINTYFRDLNPLILQAHFENINGEKRYFLTPIRNGVEIDPCDISKWGPEDEPINSTLKSNATLSDVVTGNDIHDTSNANLSNTANATVALGITSSVNDSVATTSPRWIKEMNPNELLLGLVDDSIKKAGKAAYTVDGHDEAMMPITVRHNKRSSAFYSTLANELGTSMNTAILLVLKSFAHCARPSDMPTYPRGIKEIKLDKLLLKLTDENLKQASKAAYAVDDELMGPSTMRLNKRYNTFYSTLADELGMSMNAIILLVLKSFVYSATPMDE